MTKDSIFQPTPSTLEPKAEPSLAETLENFIAQAQHHLICAIRDVGSWEEVCSILLETEDFINNRNDKNKCIILNAAIQMLKRDLSIKPF